MSDTNPAQRGHFEQPLICNRHSTSGCSVCFGPRQTPESMGDRGECARCHRTGLGLVNPRGGDGSMRKPRPHNDRDGKPCDGKYDPAVGWD